MIVELQVEVEKKFEFESIKWKLKFKGLQEFVCQTQKQLSSEDFYHT